MFRHPGRGLPLGADQPVADMLAQGVTFEQAVIGLRDIAEHARRRALEGARILDTALTLSADAPRCSRLLRSDGGLDQHFRDYEDLTGGGSSSSSPHAGRSPQPSACSPPPSEVPMRHAWND